MASKQQPWKGRCLRFLCGMGRTRERKAALNIIQLSGFHLLHFRHSRFQPLPVLVSHLLHRHPFCHKQPFGKTNLVGLEVSPQNYLSEQWYVLRYPWPITHWNCLSQDQNSFMSYSTRQRSEQTKTLFKEWCGCMVLSRDISFVCLECQLIEQNTNNGWIMINSKQS